MRPVRHSFRALAAASIAIALVWTTSTAHASPNDDDVSQLADTVQELASCPVDGVTLSWYPGPETGYDALGRHGVTPAPDVLDALASDYAAGEQLGSYGQTTVGEPDMQDFLVVWLPVWLNELMAGTVDNDHGLDPAADMDKVLWLAHLSGYYGGVWMRKNFLDFDLPLHFGLPFSDSGIDQYYRAFVDPLRLVADNGDSKAVLEATRSTVRSPLISQPTGIDSSTLLTQILPPTNNMAAYAYDSAWLENLIPPSLNAPRNAAPGVEDIIVRDPNALLDAEYGIDEVSYLQAARTAYEPVSTATKGAVKERYDQVVKGKFLELPLTLGSQRFNLYGQLIYATGIPLASNYRGFDQEQYDRLLTWAAYAVMGNQANAMNALSAWATEDTDAARTQLRSTLMWASYVGGYGWGHLSLEITDGDLMSDLMPRFRHGCG